MAEEDPAELDPVTRARLDAREVIARSKKLVARAEEQRRRSINRVDDPAKPERRKKPPR